MCFSMEIRGCQNKDMPERVAERSCIKSYIKNITFYISLKTFQIMKTFQVFNHFFSHTA